MNKFIVLALLVASAVAAPTSPEVTAAIAAQRALPAVLHEEVHDEFGQYSLRYITPEGTTVQERGRLVPNPDGTGHVLVTEGEVSYIGDDGKTYITKYSAGFDGFKAEGSHLPVAPEPVPAK